MLSVELHQLFLSDVGFVAVLKGTNDPRCLPIFIGESEAHAIALQMQKVKVPRPMTHDLLKMVLDALECRLKRVEICDLKDGVFYAQLIIETNGVEQLVDSRPSDAMALAMRFSAPIMVNERIMNEAGQVSEIDGRKSARLPVKPEDTEVAKESARLKALKVNLDKAVEEERYEDAARIRDTISVIEHTGGKN